MTIAFVRGVIAREDRLGVNRERRPPAWSARSPASAPASLICSGMVGQYGACVMTSSPSSNRRQRGVVERLLAAGRDDDFLGPVRDAVIGAIARADRLPQLDDAGRRRVLREVLVDRLGAPPP